MLIYWFILFLALVSSFWFIVLHWFVVEFVLCQAGLLQSISCIWTKKQQALWISSSVSRFWHFSDLENILIEVGNHWLETSWNSPVVWYVCLNSFNMFQLSTKILLHFVSLPKMDLWGHPESCDAARWRVGVVAGKNSWKLPFFEIVLPSYCFEMSYVHAHIPWIQSNRPSGW